MNLSESIGNDKSLLRASREKTFEELETDKERFDFLIKTITYQQSEIKNLKDLAYKTKQRFRVHLHKDSGEVVLPLDSVDSY